MPIDLVKNNFTGGEWSPAMYGRTDLQKYASATRQMTNAFCHPQGGVSNRPGTEFVTEVKDSADNARMIPFQFSVVQTYVLVFGDLYFWIIKDGAVVVYPGGHPQAGQTVEVATPYAHTDLASLKFSQSADTLYIAAGGSYQRRKITRIDHHDWSIQVVGSGSSTATPTGLGNTGGVSATTANYVLTATVGGVESLPSTSANGKVDGNLAWTSQFGVDYFTLYKDSGGSGVLGYLGDIDGNTTTYTDSNIAPDFGQSPPSENDPFDNSPQLTSISTNIVPVQSQISTWACSGGGWSAIIPAGTYVNAGSLHYALDGTVTAGQYIDTYNAGSPFTTTIEITASAAVQVSGYSLTCNDATPTTAPKDWVFSGKIGAGSWVALDSQTGQTGWTAHETRTFTFQNQVQYDFYRIQISDSNQPDHNMRLTEMELFTGTYTASINNPSVVTFFDQRLMWGRTDPKPQTVFGSRIGDFENHNISSPLRDDDAVEFTLYSTQVNEILWMVPLTDLVLLTPQAEWRMTSGDSSTITPTSINVKQQSQYGSAEVQPIVIGNTILFVQRHGKVVRDLLYSLETDGYQGNDLSVLSEHLMARHALIRWAYQKTPDSIIWAVREDGDLAAVTFLKEHEVWGWHHHTTDGTFEDVTTIASDIEEEDEVYFIVKRNVDGNDVRYVERMKKRIEEEDVENSWFVDCGLRYEGAPATVISGLTHLEDKDVAVLADGIVRTGLTVASGQITLPLAASKVLVGLPYVTRVETMDVELQSKSGSIQNQVRIIPRATFRLKDTRTMKVGQNFDVMEDMALTAIEQPVATDLFSGDHVMQTRPGDFTHGRVCIEVDEPLPLTVQSIIIELDVPND